MGGNTSEWGATIAKEESGMPLMGEAARIRGLRERLLKRLLGIIAIAGILAYGPSAYLSLKERLWVIFAADTAACVSVACLALFAKPSFRVKVAYLVGLSRTRSACSCFSIRDLLAPGISSFSPSCSLPRFSGT
jgi:hypothetical protein